MKENHISDLNLEKRKIGVEIELGNISPSECSRLIADFKQWEIIKQHDDLFELDSPYGKFIVETDAEIIKKISKEAQDLPEGETDQLSNFLKDGLGHFKGTLVPIELVSPPLEVDKLQELDEICSYLFKNGAKGTQDAFNYAFGLHLNPQVKSLEHKSILKHLQAFIILSDWLLDQIKVDTTRKITGFAKDFPEEYSQKILRSDYQPTEEEFIKDYLEYNPTRNRSLDMLPLFKYMMPDIVNQKIDDERVKSRPTFHYRLPNCMLGAPFWSINTEWKRWQKVEWLAENESFLDEAMQAFFDIRLKSSFSKSKWISLLNDLILESQ